jgi:hypothetical protein
MLYAHRNAFYALLLGIASWLLVACSQQQQYEAPPRVPGYHYVPGQTALLLRNGHAVPPKSAPPQVKRAIYAANKLVGKPYRMGGGHKRHYDSSYDCSGSVSFVLREAGLMTSIRHSRLFMKYGRPGPGRWITVYAKNGHVFMTICGLRFDTSGRGGKGPAWRVEPRDSRHFQMRHPYSF